MSVVSGIGYIGGALLGVQSAPQLLKVYRTKSAKDISSVFLSTNIAGLLCMSYYGFSTNDSVLYIPTTMSMALSTALFAMKGFYDKRDSSAEAIDL